jgi:L-Ala-D/L-Glu epimerase
LHHAIEMKCKVFPYRLQYRFPFTIANSSRTFTPNAYLLLQYQNHMAWGEAAFPPYVMESASTLEDLVRQTEWPPDPIQLDVHDFITKLNVEHPGNPFALAAIDIALHNLQAKITGIPIKSKYFIPELTKETSITLGISSENEMAEKIGLTQSAAYYKLKVDQEHIDSIIKNYLRLSAKPFVADANQGFQSKDMALQWCKKLHEMGCGYLEQPFHKADLESHRWLKNKSPIPIIADESFQRLPDLESVEKSFDGINVKLMKSSGIAEACRALKMAKELGLKTIIGCMSESSVAVGAAWNLAPLADWVDLDGPMLIKNDLFSPELGYSDEQVIERLGRFDG